MKEEVFRYGESNRGFGLVSIPDDPIEAPVAIILNAGLISREGPHRLNVLVCRALANLGYIAIRVDLSGKGDTPQREGLSNRESVALDWSFIKSAIGNRFGTRNLVLIGLCSGADNAIKIAATEKDVRGLVIIDSVSPKDKDFQKRMLLSKITNPYKWLNLPFALMKRFQQATGVEQDSLQAMLVLRDEPTKKHLLDCMHRIVENQGKILAIFTSQASYHYNMQGQFTLALDIPGFENCCSEIHWPLVDHIFIVQTHRERLVKEISKWADENLKYLLK